MAKNDSHNINQIWINTITKFTQIKPIQAPQYIRFNLQDDDETIAITIFPNSTVMVQSDNFIPWAKNVLPDICEEVNLEICKQEITENNQGQNWIEETRVEGMCMLCNDEDDKYMIHCQNKECNSWTHFNCDTINKAQIQNIKTYEQGQAVVDALNGVLCNYSCNKKGS